jgi:lysophospholipase L1-like esterase
MRRSIPWLLAALLLGPGLSAASAAEAQLQAADCPAAPPQTLSLPVTRAALREGKPMTIIAFGSSSTEGSGASTPDQSYPAQLEKRLRAFLPGTVLRVLNRGIGGQEVREMLARLRHDVLDWAPTLVIWQAGANAVLKGMDPAEFRAALAGGLAEVHASGADVVLMDSQRSPRILASPRAPLIDAALQELAADQHLPLFSRAKLMRAWASVGVSNDAMLGPDKLHHNDRGYRCVAAALAESIIKALRPSPPVMAGRMASTR